MPSLRVLRDDDPVFRHQLRPGRTIIGRSDRCDIALPSDRISRIHCIVEQRGEAWWLCDRSQNGTLVSGETVSRRLLHDGDRFEVGAWTIELALSSEPSDELPTVTGSYAPARHEELVELSSAGVIACRAELQFTRGPHAGRTVPLERGRTSLGGPGADIVLDDELPRRALKIRVARGRPMVEPADAVAFLEGQRLREVTPVLAGEEVRLRAHGFTLGTRTSSRASAREGFGELVGSSPKMQSVFGSLARMAPHDDCVLVTGESGTGKELAARALHEAGPRHTRPFVPVNCAAIAANLFESELFGHVKGAFTGASRDQPGAFQRADRGTLFLDEVGELPLDAQAKLLRALESGEVRRVGGREAEFPDVRVVAATNRDLLAMVQEGSFREDLYFRLAVLMVDMPPLRERPEDILPIARALLARNHPDASLGRSAGDRLLDHDWPGNVRELRNVLTRAVVLGGHRITAQSLSFQAMAFEAPVRRLPLRSEAERTERAMILDALERCGGNRSQAARALGMPRTSLLYRLKRLGIR